MKRTLLLITSVFVLSVRSYARRAETFDVATFPIPVGRTKEVGEGNRVFGELAGFDRNTEE